MNSSNTFEFPRDIYGMLYDPDTQRYSGAMEDIAYSEGINSNILGRIADFVKIGFEETGSPEKDIYSFFPINNKQYALCHSESIENNDNTGRRTLLFTDFIIVTEDELYKLNWNLHPIFNLFDKAIPNFFQKKRGIDPYKLNTRHVNNTIWFSEIREKKDQIKSILVDFLSSSKSVRIQPTPKDPLERLSLLCKVVMCLPTQISMLVSFSTLANYAGSTAKISFPVTRTTGSEASKNHYNQDTDIKQVGKTYNSVKVCAYFVTHIGKEGTFELIRLLCFLSCRYKLFFNLLERLNIHCYTEIVFL